MPKVKRAPFELWLSSAQKAHQDLLAATAVNYRTAIKGVINRKDISDEVFAQVISLLLQNLNRDIKSYAAELQHEVRQLQEWEHGVNLPIPSRRSAFLELCTQAAWSNAQDDPYRIMQSLLPSNLGNNQVELPPDWNTPPDDVPGWFNLTKRTQNILKNEGITLFGELAACTEVKVLRFQNCGRGTLNEIKKWLKRFGLELPITDEKVPEHLQKFVRK